MAVRGFLWYQGEFNVMDRELYEHKQRMLTKVWRRLWGEPLPFYFVQLPGHGRIYRGHFPGLSDDRIRLCEAQMRTLSVPNTGMVVTIDIGDKDDNHPPNKLDVGRRLARLLLAETYGRDDLVPTGPIYRSHELRDGRFVVHFDHVGRGLMVGRKPTVDGKVTTDPVEEVKDGKLRHFAICGEDRIWHWADAVIAGETVIVSSPAVPEPVALRYAFSTWPEGANLYNRDGLPAAPFRTDDWSREEEHRNPPGP
jgi:sialate O-acetylesterase